MMDLYRNCRMVPKLINSLGLDTVSELDVRDVGLALIYNGKLQGNTLCLKRNSNRPSIKTPYLKFEWWNQEEKFQQTLYLSLQTRDISKSPLPPPKYESLGSLPYVGLLHSLLLLTPRHLLCSPLVAPTPRCPAWNGESYV